MNNDEGHLFVETEVMRKLSRKIGNHLFGCLLGLVSHAESNGEIAYETAVKLLAAAPDMNEQTAQKNILQLVKTGWLVEKDEQLAIKGYGTSFIQDRRQGPPN